MKRYLGLLIMIGLLLALAAPVEAQEAPTPEPVGLRPDAPTYALHGPHTVGFMTFSDGAEERPMEGGIWYPALNPDGMEEIIAYESGIGDIVPPLATIPGHAVLDAPPDTSNGPYPLVIGSHGHTSPVYATAYLYEHLASQGFVVMAMIHSGNSLRDAVVISSDEDEAAFQQTAIDHLVLRPMDVSQTLDYAEVLAENDMAGMIDMEHVAVIGYSYGGATALVAGGMRYDFRDLSSICGSSVNMSIISSTVCDVYGENLDALEPHLLEVAGLSAAPDGMFPSLADPRIDSVVALMPGGGTVLTSEASIADLTLPTLLTRAGNDEMALPEYNVNKAWQFSGASPRALVTLGYASHTVGMWCPPGMCLEPVWDKDRTADLVDHFTTAFLLDVLKGDSTAHAALAPDAVSFPGIQYQTQGF